MKEFRKFRVDYKTEDSGICSKWIEAPDSYTAEKKMKEMLERDGVPKEFYEIVNIIYF